jgi:adenylate cyclase
MPGWLGTFVGELKRRRVLRVAVAYGVAAGGTLQAASVVVPALHMADWWLTMAVLAAGAGFPVAMVLAWTFDLTKEGVVRTPETPSSGDRRHAGVGVLLAAALVVAGGAGGAWWWLRPASTSGASHDTVAVLPFTVRGSTQFAYLGEGMVDLLGASLSRGGALRTVDSRTLLRFVGHDDLDAQRSREVATHFGAGLFVLGDVLEVERRLRIHAALYDADKPGNPVAEATSEGEAGALFSLVDDVLRQLRPALLGSNAQGPAGRFVQLAQATTSSLPALKAYLEGEKAMRTRDWNTAQRAFQRAVDEDPSFALANYRLAVTAGWSHDPLLLLAASRRASAGKDRLSERQSRMVDAFSALATGRIRDSEAKYRQLVADEPDDVESWYHLGEIAFHYGAQRGLSLAEMREPLERAVAIDPEHPGALTHLFDLALVEGRGSDELALLDRLLAGADPSKPNPERWERAWAMGDVASQRREEERIVSGGTAAQVFQTVKYSLSHRDGFADAQRLLETAGKTLDAKEPNLHGRLLVIVAAARGRYLDAKRLLETEAEPLRTATWAERSALMFVPAKSADLLAAADVVRRLPREPRQERKRLYMLGRLLARAGDARGAEAQAAALEQTTDDEGTSTGRDLALSVRAHLAAATNHPAESLRLLEQMDVQIPYGGGDKDHWWPSGVPERMLRAQLLRDLGRYAEALRWATTREPGELDEAVYLAPRLLLEGEIQEHLDARHEASTAYARAVQLWKDCDPELRPRVVDAQRRLEALRFAAR